MSMRVPVHLTAILLVAAHAASCATQIPDQGGSVDSLLSELLTLERAALERWIRLDPDGYLALYATDVTYFDPTTERRIAGATAMQTRLAPMRTMKPPFSDPRYEFIDPKVQRHGEVAVLTFNLVNYGKLADGAERELARWNSTEVYAQLEGTWRIVHSHWSYVQAQPKSPES